MKDLEAARNELAAANQQPITPTNITRRQMAADELDRHTLEAIAPSQPLEKVVDALATGLAECCTDHGAHRDPPGAASIEYARSRTPDPREKLIDELAAALDRITDYITDLSQGGRD